MNEHEMLKKLAMIVANQQEVLKRLAVTKDGRELCNCENSKCEHEPAGCGNIVDDNSPRALYIGEVCEDCASRMPPEYMVENNEHRVSWPEHQKQHKQPSHPSRKTREEQFDEAILEHSYEVDNPNAQKTFKLPEDRRFRHPMEDDDNTANASIRSITTKIAQMQAQDIEGYLKRALNTAVGNVGSIRSQFHSEVSQSPSGYVMTAAFTPALAGNVESKVSNAFYSYVANQPDLAGKVSLTFAHA